MVTSEKGEVENDESPSLRAPAAAISALTVPAAARDGSKTATRHRPIDVVTVDPQPEPTPDGPEVAFSSANRVSLSNLFKLIFINYNCNFVKLS
jgi:hypothetical protein